MFGVEIEIEQYLSHIKNIRRYSRHTITAYKTDLLQFNRFAKKNLLVVTVKDVRDYLLHLKIKDYSFRTINRKLEVLRSFYRYHRRFTDYKNYPCAHISSLRFVKPRGRYITQATIMKVLNDIEPDGNRKTVRDALVLELLYQTGCGADEIINLRKVDINFDRLQIKVFGKGKIQRIIPVGKKLVELIMEHLKLWESKNQTTYLITTDKGNQMYPMFCGD